MDSDEDEEFSFEENIGQRPDRHGGKLNEILSEVETKIPSLEFDDDDNGEDISVWSPPDNVPSFYKQFTFTLSSEEATSHQNQHDKQITEVVSSSSMSSRTDNDPLVSWNEPPTTTTLGDKTDSVVDEIHITAYSPFSLKSCETDNNPLVDKRDGSTAILENTSATFSAFDNTPITTLQPSSSLYTSYQKNSDSIIFDDILPISDKKSTSINIPQSLSFSCHIDSDSHGHNLPITASGTKTADVKMPNSMKIVPVVSSRPTDRDLLVHQQNLPLHKPSEKEILDISEASSQSLLCQLDSNQGINSNHTRGSRNALNDEPSLVPTKALGCQTDNEPSIHKHHISTILSEKAVNLNAPNDEQVSSSYSLRSTVSCQTDNDLFSHQPYLPMTKSSEKVVIDEQISRNTKMDVSEQMLDSKERNIETDEAIQVPYPTEQIENTPYSIAESDTEYGDKLDFNLLNEINFSELQSVLGTLPSKHALSVSHLLPSTSQQSGQSKQTAGDAELMSQLSHLSKDQLSACTSVLDGKSDIMAESLYQKKRKVKGNRGSAKAIHTWSQLSSDHDTSTQERQTIFLDLRPEATLETEKEEEEYSESIQRILGLNKERSDSFSDEGSDDELTEWREMRTKLKERAKQEPENHKKSAHTHASKLTRKPFPRRIPNTTVEKLHEEELTGGLPLDTRARYENVASKELELSAGNIQSHRESNAKVQGKVEESPCLNSRENRVLTQSGIATQTDASISSGCKIDKHIQSDGCLSEEEKYKAQSISQTMGKDENFIDAKLCQENIEAQNDPNGQLACKVEKDETFSESHTTPSSTNTYDPTHARENIYYKENGEYTSSFGKHENPNEENVIVECDEKEEIVATQQCGVEKGLDSSSSIAFTSRNKRHIQLDERTASCNGKSEEKQLTLQETDGNDLSVDQLATPLCESVLSSVELKPGSISTADIRIRLRLSGTEENASDQVKNLVRNSSLKEKEEQCKKREELAESRESMSSTEKMEENSRYKTNVKPSKTLTEQKTDTSTPHTTNREHSEEKTSIVNGQDISQKRKLSNDVLDVDLRTVCKIIDYMKEEKSKQSLTSNPRSTPTPNNGEKKQTNKNKLDKFSKPQKQRSQKELKKLKEKLRINIENMRPTVTASGKYPAAYNTPIIYDQGASFEPHQQGLLSTLEDQLSVLLVVTLSGCGEINYQYSKGKGLGSGSEINHYFALLSWLCYLCGPHNGDESVPFTVVGIQQACQNGLLQLFVGVQPNEKIFDPNATKGSKKNKTRPFHKAISKYLSTHSLRRVYQNIENVYLNGSIQVDENAYSSKMLSTYITVGQDLNAVQRVFNSQSCFYWETVELEGSNDVFQDNSSCDMNVENTVVFLRAPLYYRPSCVLDLLTRIENEGCDVAGLRLTSEHDSSASVVCHNDPQHTLALTVRGPFAITKMKKIIGSKIPLLDDPREIPSLRSLYCSTNTEDKLFYCPSYFNQAATHLARVFGGRLTEDGIGGVEDPNGKPKACSPDSVPAQKPPAFLVSSTHVAFFLIISPLVPPSFLGELLHTCFLRSFVLHGIRRVQLSKRQGTNLGFSQLQFNVFCPSSGNTPVHSPSGSPPGSPARRKSNFSLEATLALTKTNRSYPSTILILQKENGLYHAASLVKDIFESLKDWMTTNPTSSLPDVEETTPRMYLTITQINEASSKSLWGDVCYKPDTSLLKHARNNRISLNSEAEQVCVLSSVNKEAIQHVGILLKKLTNSNRMAGDWELLGMKSFPSLSLVQAREVTPYEIGDRSWLSSIKLLMSTAVFVCVLRGTDIIQRLRDFMIALAKMSTKEDCCLHEGWWLSQTTEVTYRQLTVLFEESELFSDETNRTNTTFVPPLRQKSSQSSTQNESKAALQQKRRKLFDHKACSTDDSSTSVETTQFSGVLIIQSLLVGPRPLPTIVLIKPSCVVNTKKIGKIFKSVLQENFDIVALSMRVLTQSEAQVLVRVDESDYNDHIQYLTSGTSLVICLQRENAVKKLLDILGPEDPIIARSLDPFLLRGCYGVDSIHNAIHGSESYSSAICELKMLFPCGVCCDQSIDLEAEQISCRAFDGTIGKKTERKLTKNLTKSSTAHSLISSLVQVNCVILTHHILYGRSDRKRIALVDVLECLLSANFVPVGMKMAMLSREQVNEFLMLIGSKAGRKQNLENELTEGPCIILALQRDNAFTCFDSIIESVEGKRRSITEHRKHIIQAQTEEEARNLLMYFFDGLAPNSVQQICQV